MNFRDLEYLVAVSETLHFGQAAQRCFVSQPTLSGQIHKLEEELGATLFERTNRSVHITAIGQRSACPADSEQAEVIRPGSDQNDLLTGRFGSARFIRSVLIWYRSSC